MAKLGVNIDHVATLRQARGESFPDPVRAALICQKAGAHSIVMHLREDRRHIQDKDLFRVQQALKIRLNMEMSAAPDIVRVALRLKPDQVTLVPEKRQERTTESGLNLSHKTAHLRRCIEAFKKNRISVSIFLDPNERQIQMARRLGADAIEFHTGIYANAKGAARNKELKRIRQGVLQARERGLAAHAGHGLNYENAQAIARIPGIDELNIGYAIVAQSLWEGLASAVGRMKELIR